MEWFTVSEERIPIVFPPGVRVRKIEKQNMESLLERGKMDVLITGGTPRSINNNDGKLRRLFADYAEEEKKYFRKTKLFPIMHTFVIRKEVLLKYPWLAKRLYDALLAAKEYSRQMLRQPVSLMITYPWIAADIEEFSGWMGEDCWPYGLESNCHTLQSVVRFSREQGLMQRELALEELFPLQV
jgi:4,5-dihydroxyphthalate decarboxylase